MLAAGPPIDAVLLVKPEPEHHHRSSVGPWQLLLLLDHLVGRDDPDRALPVPTIDQRRSQDEQLFHHLLDAFTTQRADLLAVLEPLAPENRDRAATVTVAGKSCERTVLFYAQWLAEYERAHVKQR